MQTESVTKFVRVNTESGAYDESGIMVMVSDYTIETECRSVVAEISCKFGTYTLRREYDRDGADLGWKIKSERGSEHLPIDIALNIIHANHFWGKRLTS